MCLGGDFRFDGTRIFARCKVISTRWKLISARAQVDVYFPVVKDHFARRKRIFFRGNLILVRRETQFGLRENGFCLAILIAGAVISLGKRSFVLGENGF